MPWAFELRDFYFQDSMLLIPRDELASSNPVRVGNQRFFLWCHHKSREPRKNGPSRDGTTVVYRVPKSAYLDFRLQELLWFHPEHLR
jgi:hypothetical protein